MSVDTTPQVKPPASHSKLLIIIGAAIVVLLAVIAIAVSSQAIRANNEAAAKEKAVEDTRAGAKAVADQKAADVENATHACEQAVLKKHPTADFKASNTRSTLKAYDGSYEINGTYTDDALYGNHIPMQFICSSTKGSGTSWSATLTALGSQSGR
jgi:hypothetical protein